MMGLPNIYYYTAGYLHKDDYFNLKKIHYPNE